MPKYFTNLYLFLLGIFLFVRVQLVGVLTVSEISLIALIPFIGARALLFAFTNPYIKRIIGFWALYFVGLILSDLVRNTPIEDLQRGWAKVGILGLNIILLSYLTQLKTRPITYFLWGFALSSLFNDFLIYPTYSDAVGRMSFGELWKMSTGHALTILIGLLLSTGLLGRSLMTKGLIFIGLGIAHMLLNARSLGGITLITGLLAFTPPLYFANLNPNQVYNPRLIITLLAGLSAIYFFYTFGASAGYFGELAKAKYIEQTGSDTNLILGGRTESVASLTAISDSPLLGHGSWAKNQQYILLYLKAQRVDRSSYQGQELLRQGYIPTHSHLLGAWVEAGILGFLFWLVALVSIFKGIIYCLSNFKLQNRQLYLFIFVTLIWDIIFSPFGLERRLTNPIFILLSLSLLSDYNLLSAQRKKFIHTPLRKPQPAFTPQPPAAYHA